VGTYNEANHVISNVALVKGAIQWDEAHVEKVLCLDPPARRRLL
jgi:hypothetical protein